MRPLCDVPTLLERQAAIEYLSAPRNDEIATTLHDFIKHVKNIPVSSRKQKVNVFLLGGGGGVR